MRVSPGKVRMRASAAMRRRCAGSSPEKKRAWPRTAAVRASSMRTLSPKPLAALGAGHHLPEARELVLLHEHGVLGAGIAARAHVVAVVGEALLDDRHEVGVDLRVPRRMRLV